MSMMDALKLTLPAHMAGWQTIKTTISIRTAADVDGSLKRAFKNDEAQ